MKRLFLALGVALAVTALAVGTGTAGDTKGPKCTDIVAGAFSYQSTGVVGGDATLASAACDSWTYKLYILDPTETEIGSDEGSVDPTDPMSTTINFSTTLTEPLPNSVCVYAETLHKGRVSDRAPDTGCVSMDKGSSGGDSGFS